MLLAGPTLAGCSAPPQRPTLTAAPASGGASRTNTVIFANFSEARSLNPLLAPEGASQLIWENIFEPLVAADPRTGSPTPVLAEGWALAPDGLAYTLHLRQGVTWSDGQPFTAEDVKFTYDTAIDPQKKTVVAGRFDNLAAFDVVDPQTLRVTLKEPFCPFLINGLTLPILPKHRLANSTSFDTDEFNSKTPVGTGPYKFEEWKRDDHLTLVANPTYWRGKPRIERWMRRVVKDTNVVVAQLKTGEVDYGYIDPASLADVQQQSHLAVFPFFGPGYDMIAWNEANPLFQDARVRQALTHGLDREQIVQTVLFGQGQSIHSPILPFYWAHNPNVPTFAYDPEQAKQRLSQAGWAPGSDGILQRNGQRFAFTLATNAGTPIRLAVATVAQDQYRKLGIQVDIQSLEANAFLAKLKQSHEFDAVIYGVDLRVDPDQTSFWASNQYARGDNYVRYNNPRVDQLLEQARRVASCSEADRKPLYDQVQQEIAQDQPYTFLYMRKALVAANKRVQNFGPTPWARPAWNIYDWSLSQ
jgi:peptide/nickel transport system substrate-binding protein